MWQGQARLVDDLVAVDEQVEVDSPRAEALTADAAEALLDIQQSRQELPRRQISRYLDRAVQKGPLLDRPDGLGLAEPGDGDDLDSLLGAKTVERRAQMSLTVAEI